MHRALSAASRPCGATTRHAFCGATTRRFATTGVPDYYAVLGVPRSATAEQVKAAFRERAKLYHPDVNAARGGDAVSSAPLPAPPPGVGVDATPLDVFKLINEAYGVLSEPAMRRDYDADRFSRTDLLRRRNEGWTPGDATTRDATDAAGLPAEYSPEPRRQPTVEDFRDSMARASAKYADGLRGRATMARVEMPSQRDSLLAMAFPAAVVALWAFNYVVFLR